LRLKALMHVEPTGFFLTRPKDSLESSVHHGGELSKFAVPIVMALVRDQGFARLEGLGDPGGGGYAQP
jgi:hypothetical protein